ncbi:MAG: type IV pilus secretin PilQ [Cellvibrionaceae bacterium]|nr:type IV pilus secretin PilQ [Cellvibrionaceae bacterium]
MIYFRLAVTLWLLLLGAVHSVAATLQDLDFTELAGGSIQITASFADAPVMPKGFIIQQPARIVLDFSDIDNRLTQKKFPLSFDNAKSAVVLTSNERTRLIVNLAAPSTYSTVIRGKDLIATIDGIKQAETFTRQQASEAAQTPFTDSDGLSITDIDFRRTEEGAGNLLINLSQSQVSVDIEENASGVVVNFADTALPSKLRRRLDVLDFATPVKIIEAQQNGKNTQFTVEVSGDYEYLAYQTDEQYVITVKPLTEEQLAERKERFKFVGEKLSLNFQDIKVRAVLEIIADFTNLNLVASDTVEGNITLRLDNVPWDQALDLVLKSKSLDKRQIGNVLLVAPAAEIAERERQEIETRNQLQELAPLRTEFIRIRYASAKDIFELFKGDDAGEEGSASGASESTKGILSSRGSAIVDERTNSIILTETEDKIAEFKTLIQELDIPIRQVMIESRIVIASSDFRKELGVRAAGEAARNADGNTLELSGTLDGFVNNDGQGPEGVFLDSDGDGFSDDERSLAASNLVNLGVGEAAGTVAFNILTDSLLLGLELSALESSGLAEVVSQPKVITGDKQQATIESGQEIPYQVLTDNGVSIQFREAVLKLDVTPQITPDNRVIMDLVINQDSVSDIEVVSNTSAVPIIDTNELNTKVLVGDGQTIVLGGIFQQNTVTGQTKVPLLGDIPVLGRLFRQDIKRDEKQELLIFITPKILTEAVID